MTKTLCPLIVVALLAVTAGGQCAPMERRAYDRLIAELSSLRARISQVEKRLREMQVNGEHCPRCGRLDRVAPVPGNSARLYCHRCFMDWRQGEAPKIPAQERRLGLSGDDLEAILMHRLVADIQPRLP
jgi:hypothetical protein